MLSMDIRTYLDSLGRGAGAALARSIGVHPVMVSQWAAETKPIPVERCTAIEQATARAVMRWDLRPDDWWKIWPELVNAHDAPPLPAKEGA